MPYLLNKIPTYTDFASKSIEQIIGKNLEAALHYAATEFRSGIFVNEGKGFVFQPLANEAQQSVINSIVWEDFDGDGLEDLLMAGNNYQAEIETTRSDAGTGIFMKGTGKGTFEYIPSAVTGFVADEDTRGLVALRRDTGSSILVLNNNASHLLFTTEKLNQQ